MHSHTYNRAFGLLLANMFIQLSQEGFEHPVLHTAVPSIHEAWHYTNMAWLWVRLACIVQTRYTSSTSKKEKRKKLTASETHVVWKGSSTYYINGVLMNCIVQTRYTSATSKKKRKRTNALKTHTVWKRSSTYNLNDELFSAINPQGMTPEYSLWVRVLCMVQTRYTSTTSKKENRIN